MSTDVAIGVRGVGAHRESQISPASRYPVELIDVVTLRNGHRVTIRPVLPQDDGVTKAFFMNLSLKSRHSRFMSALNHLPQNLLTRFTHVDYRTHLALIAEVFLRGQEIAIGEARYVVSGDGTGAEFALSIADVWQGLGLGSLLIERLINTARKSGIAKITGETLASNAAMLHLASKAGFSSARDPEIGGLVHLTLNLTGESDRRPL